MDQVIIFRVTTNILSQQSPVTEFAINFLLSNHSKTEREKKDIISTLCYIGIILCINYQTHFVFTFFHTILDLSPTQFRR